jgi:hypothetical protein
MAVLGHKTEISDKLHAPVALFPEKEPPVGLHSGQQMACLIVWRKNKMGHVRIDVILRNFRETIVAIQKKEVLHILSVSVALVIQHAKRMRRILLSTVTFLALPYFSIFFHKRHGFWENFIEHRMCAFILSATCLKHF